MYQILSLLILHLIINLFMRLIIIMGRRLIIVRMVALILWRVLSILIISHPFLFAGSIIAFLAVSICVPFLKPRGILGVVLWWSSLVARWGIVRLIFFVNLHLFQVLVTDIWRLVIWINLVISSLIKGNSWRIILLKKVGITFVNFWCFGTCYRI